MSGNFHETYAHGDVRPPSERSTGLVFAGVAVIVAVIWRHSPIVPWVALAVGAALAALSMTAPDVLKPLNLLWFRLGLLLSRVVNPLVMLAMFAFVFVPAGFIMRLWHDPLASKRATTRSTYWIERQGVDRTKGSMTNQF